MLAPALEPELPLAEITGESARIPLQGWTVRLAPIANKVLSVRHGSTEGPCFPPPNVFHRASGHRHAVAESRRAAPQSSASIARDRYRVRAGADASRDRCAPRRTRRRMPPSPFRHRRSRLRPRSPICRPVAQALPAAAPAVPLSAGDKRVAPSGDPAGTSAKANTPSADRGAAAIAAHAEAGPLESADKVVAAARGSAAKPAPPAPKGFGYLTVHSSNRYAYVYVQLIRYGQVERRIIVRCGKRFVSLGAPRPTGGEPIWYAPSRTVDIPCGGSVDVTMMPKWIP